MQHMFGFQAILNDVQEVTSEPPRPLKTIESFMNQFDAISIMNPYHIHHLIVTHFHKGWHGGLTLKPHFFENNH